ncbi:F-box/kelch-repeat protein At3g23880-like [Corylus avellana]|uniref:F-box/kelch-repeat protein At3g23880-like n=1 Tax=Corylus avellana TaxID=13451 RepID=UPI001E218D2B|nr:F-box/kelch-repeat protein At3g23880-like [Corylus avellana]
MMMAKELPEDLVTQILLRLPVVSLLRFESVCKSWYALITHQHFKGKHLLHNKKNSNNTLLLPLSTYDDVVPMLSYETLQVSLTQSLPPPYFVIDEEARCPYSIIVVGSCNGLVCLFNNYSLQEFIWNPATKETKVVPKSNMFPSGYHANLKGIGFGFDAKANDYKIINLLTPYDNPDPKSFRSGNIIQSEVYTLSADSWKKVDIPLSVTIDRFYAPMIYINGMAFWRAYADDWEGVLSFDMSDEVFLKTPLPLLYIRDFFVLNESTTLAVGVIAEDGFDIWLLLEVGVKDSWSKLFTIGPFTDIMRPLGFWKNGIMFLEKCDGQMVLYDPSTKQMTDLLLGHSWSQLITYMETLISVKRENVFEEQDRC